MKILYVVTLLFLSFSANAQVFNADDLKLTDEQNQRLIQLKEEMNAEIQPIWEEIQSGKTRVLEIEKKYFEAFWKMLNEDQKKEFNKLKNK